MEMLITVILIRLIQKFNNKLNKLMNNSKKLEKQMIEQDKN